MTAADSSVESVKKPARAAGKGAIDPAGPKRMADAIRALAMDAVQKANSGHPGMPMGMADIAVALWSRHLRHNPADPLWPDRDRFLLSNGHGSMLQYALLHLTGYDLPMKELENFRQLHSKTPGHPEVDLTPGIETTTGPLGQGFANSVGMALTEKLLAEEFNRPGHPIVDHHTYVFMGDGCMMEGIGHEAGELAAAWKLNKLVAFYDDNGISIDGKIGPWFVEDTAARFRAYGWQVIGPLDGHDVEAVDAAIETAHASTTQPTLIVCRTVIGQGSPNRAGTAKAHGEALGAEEVALARLELDWPFEPFVIPPEIYAAWDAHEEGARRETEWNEKFAAYSAAHPDLARDYQRRVKGELPPNFADVCADVVAAAHAKAETVATRKASQIALEAFTAALPEMLGGSADLTGSNLTDTKSTPRLRFQPDGAVVRAEDGKIGRYISYGVREFGMAAIMNGVALHGGYIPYGGTFLTFSDYSRNAIRMGALMHRRIIHVFTHDSIGLGEDGPTHQSVEHAAALRLIPFLDVWRPADTMETAVAWSMALANGHRPSALLLSRQNLPYLPKVDANVITQGGYVLAEPSEVGRTGKPKVVLIATGSEVHLAMQAQVELAKYKIGGTRRVRAVDERVRSPGCRLQAQRIARRHPARRDRGRRDRRLVEVRLRGRRGPGPFRRIRAGPGAVRILRFHHGQCRGRRAQGAGPLRMAGRAFRRVRGRAPGVVALALAFVLAADGALAEEPAASSAAAAAETRGSSAGGGGATITDVPSPAVNCMTPPVEQRVKPEYPADMLRMKEGSRIPVELVFTDPAAAPEINFPKDTGDAFEDAVRAYARTLRIPCMKHDAGAVKLRQEFTFVPNDGRKVGWTTPIDEANTEHRCLRLPSAKDARLAYPPDLLRSDRQGTVVVVLHFHAADAAPTYDLLYDGGHRHFAAAVQPYIDQLRLPCFSGQPYDIGIHFNFRIAGESYRKRIFNDLQLPQFLQVVKPIPAGSAFYDTTTMNCPFDVRLTFRQPYATNRVEELGADVPARHAFIDWLARQEIDTSLLGKIPAAELLDQDMTIHVPCATIDL